jgi:hypothetical protein
MHVKLNIQKTEIIYLTYKINSIHFNCHISDVKILRTNLVLGGLGVMLNTEYRFLC